MRLRDWLLRLGARPSIRARLLLWLSLSLLVFLGVDVWASFRSSLLTAQLAYDRLLVTSAHAIADLIRLERGQLVIGLPHAALEIYGTPIDANESTSGGQMLYRAGFFRGDYLAGDKELKPYDKRPEVHPIYRSMIDLYDTAEGPEPMRVAALLQPVESFDGTRLVMVQVAEPLHPRMVLARRILAETLARGIGLLVLSLGMFWAVSRLALRPLEGLAARLEERHADDLSALQLPQPPNELKPLIGGFNGLLERLRQAQEQQRRFVADASHQLRTPLTVLQLEASAGLKGDISPTEALESVARTTQRASHLAEQLLSLARAQQLHPSEAMHAVDLHELARDVAVELSPLMANKSLEFQFDGMPCSAHTHGWMLREILMNLLKNAIEFTPEGGALGMALKPAQHAEYARLDIIVWDSGPGLSEAMLVHVFKPFATDRPTRGAGLGLAICKDLARAAGAQLSLKNRGSAAAGLPQRSGLVACVSLETSAPARAATTA